jgi:hypothetical protein
MRVNSATFLSGGLDFDAFHTGLRSSHIVEAFKTLPEQEGVDIVEKIVDVLHSHQEILRSQVERQVDGLIEL